MYRILIVRSHRDNYASLYQFLVETTEQGETYPVEIETKEQLDEVVENMLNNGGYSKSDFIIVKYVDYVIDAINYTDEDEDEDEEDYDDEYEDNEEIDPDSQEDDG